MDVGVGNEAAAEGGGMCNDPGGGGGPSSAAGADKEGEGEAVRGESVGGAEQSAVEAEGRGRVRASRVGAN